MGGATVLASARRTNQMAPDTAVKQKEQHMSLHVNLDGIARPDNSEASTGPLSPRPCPSVG